MSADVGSIVSFTSPTGNAILKGQIVVKKPAKKMFKEYKKSRFDADESIYSIRVIGVLKQHKEKYNPPTVCKVPEDKINAVLVPADKALEKSITEHLSDE